MEVACCRLFAATSRFLKSACRCAFCSALQAVLGEVDILVINGSSSKECKRNVCYFQQGCSYIVIVCISAINSTIWKRYREEKFKYGTPKAGRAHLFALLCDFMERLREGAGKQMPAGGAAGVSDDGHAEEAGSAGWNDVACMSFTKWMQQRVLADSANTELSWTSVACQDGRSASFHLKVNAV